MVQRIRPNALAFLSLAALNACATLSPERTPEALALFCAPIDVALSTPPASLLAQATSGDAQAQFAYSIVLGYGLSGAEVNASDAEAWRGKAIAPRGAHMTSVYVPGGKHQTGSVMMVSVPTVDVPLEQQMAVDACLAALNAPIDVDHIQRIKNGACGGEANFQKLHAAWLVAKSAAPSSSPKP